ncbi:MAG: alpha-L-rhamnosidase-related protein [Chloroflexota bacterium]
MSDAWRGQWIWDREPAPVSLWGPGPRPEGHFVYLRRAFTVGSVPASAAARATGDSRYALYLNGVELGRGPVRGEPEFLGWDEYELAPHLRPGRNVLVALCRYYGLAGPWWLPAAPSGTLGQGGFCFETERGSPIDVVTDATWRAVPAPWQPAPRGALHATSSEPSSEIVDGRLMASHLHDPEEAGDGWPAAVVLAAGLGTVRDRPPAPPYTSPRRRPIPQMTSRRLSFQPMPALSRTVRAQPSGGPTETWHGLDVGRDGDRVLTVWDLGGMSLGRVSLRVESQPRFAGQAIDLAAGEDLMANGLPEIRPREWTARYIVAGHGPEGVTFFDAVGLRYLALHHPSGVVAQPELEEAIYPRPEGAAFHCDDERFSRLWRIGARTVDLCSTDAFIDCPGREQRAWVGDGYVHTLVACVTNPDLRLARHALEMAASSRRREGLLAMAAACDLARSALTIPDYSLHWMRTLARYWEHSGDETFVRSLLPVAEGIIERYEAQRGASGLLEDFPGWVFLDWAQCDRDTVTAAHDALYVAALRDYARLPGAQDVVPLTARTEAAFEALWDAERHIYVDAIGPAGRSRRMSQHTNAAALLAGLVPAERVNAVVSRAMHPEKHGGRLALTATPADLSGTGAASQYQPPAGFDAERDVVAAQPFFSRFVHEALFRHGRRDLLFDSLLRWDVQAQDSYGTFQEYWTAAPGRSSRCHGWSASPTYDLTAYVLGVRPLTPGYAQAIVDPYLGPLRWAAGRVPTPRGWLEVTVQEGSVQVAVPVGMVVRVGEEEVGSGEHRLSHRASSDPG